MDANLSSSMKAFKNQYAKNVGPAASGSWDAVGMACSWTDLVEETWVSPENNMNEYEA